MSERWETADGDHVWRYDGSGESLEMLRSDLSSRGFTFEALDRGRALRIRRGIRSIDIQPGDFLVWDSVMGELRSYTAAEDLPGGEGG